jgi:hypothetical protein
VQPDSKEAPDDRKLALYCLVRRESNFTLPIGVHSKQLIYFR